MGGFRYLRVADLVEQQLCVSLAREIMITYKEFEVLDMIKLSKDIPPSHSVAYKSLCKKGAIDDNGLTNKGVNMLEEFITVEFGY